MNTIIKRRSVGDIRQQLINDTKMYVCPGEYNLEDIVALEKIENMKEFVKEFMRITQCSQWDLPDELVCYLD